MDAFERFKRKYCAYEFGTVMPDGRMTDVLNDNDECVPDKNDRKIYYVQAINMFSDDFMKNGRVDNIKQQREKL